MAEPMNAGAPGGHAEPSNADLKRAVDQIAQGLTLMAETQGVHTEMLEQIVVAATEETGDSPLPDLLAAMIEELKAQRAATERVAAAMERLAVNVEVPIA